MDRGCVENRAVPRTSSLSPWRDCARLAENRWRDLINSRVSFFFTTNINSKHGEVSLRSLLRKSMRREGWTSWKRQTGLVLMMCAADILLWNNHISHTTQSTAHVRRKPPGLRESFLDMFNMSCHTLNTSSYKKNYSNKSKPCCEKEMIPACTVNLFVCQQINIVMLKTILQ